MTTTSTATIQHPLPSGLPRIVLATENQGKVEELRILVGPEVDVFDLRQLGIKLPEETGSTFEENAVAKAEFVATATGLLAIADDSGLEVEQLDGIPGVRTARYAGEDASDADNRAKLLAALRDTPVSERGARFVSVIAIAQPDEPTFTTRGTCDGAIALAERGTGGFGYDSIFQLIDGRTMAELQPDQKNAISHRGAAMRLAIPELMQRIRDLSAQAPRSENGA